MDLFLSVIYKNDILQLLNQLKDNNNLLLISTDNIIIESVLKKIKEEYKKLKWSIEEIRSKNSIKNNTLVLIRIDGSTALNINILLYYYLELSNDKKCKVVFYSQNMSSIDNMERRVKSRFSNVVCFFRPLSFDNYFNLYKYLVYKDFMSNPQKRFEKRASSVQLQRTLSKNSKDSLKLINSILKGNEDVDYSKNNLSLAKMLSLDIKNILGPRYDVTKEIKYLLHEFTRNKYGLDKFTLGSMLDILKPVHLVILLMSTREKVLFSNVVSNFRKFVTNCKELKKCKDDEVFNSFCDVVEYNLLSEQGNLLIDEVILRKFINLPDKPNFLKSLLNKKILK